MIRNAVNRVDRCCRSDGFGHWRVPAETDWP